MKPEAKVQKAIKEAFTRAGFDVYDTSQGYRREPGGTRMTPGLSDLIIMGHGYLLAVEVKAGKNKPTPFQALFLKLWRENGGEAYVMRSADDAIRWMESVGIVNGPRPPEAA